MEIKYRFNHLFYDGGKIEKYDHNYHLDRVKYLLPNPNFTKIFLVGPNRYAVEYELEGQMVSDWYICCLDANSIIKKYESHNWHVHYAFTNCLVINGKCINMDTFDEIEYHCKRPIFMEGTKYIGYILGADAVYRFISNAQIFEEGDYVFDYGRTILTRNKNIFTFKLYRNKVPVKPFQIIATRNERYEDILVIDNFILTADNVEIGIATGDYGLEYVKKINEHINIYQITNPT